MTFCGSPKTERPSLPAVLLGLLWWLSNKEYACSAGAQGPPETWVQSLGGEDALEERCGNPLQCSCLENPRDRGAWWATVQGVTKSQTRPM